MKLVKVIKMRLKEIYSKIHIVKYLSEALPIQNGLKEWDALLPLLFHFTLEYSIRKDQENQEGMELNDKHKLYILGENINTTNNNIEALLELERRVI